MVKTWPILYDFSNADYKDFQKKDRVWEKIGKEVNKSGIEMKRKWRNAKDTYIRYLRHIKTNRGYFAKCKRKWKWADEMEMFRPFLTFTARNRNLRGTNRQTTTVTIPKEEHGVVCITDIEDTSRNQTDDVIVEVQEPIRTESIPQSTSSKTPKANLQIDSVGRHVTNFFAKKEQEMDATDLLFLAHASTIKTFSGKRQAIVKMRIAKVIMEEEIQHQEELIGQ
ncbi:hypothetical protein FQA39_LY11998 [Lamprigera yunnana]|nr:hypothetical protein FQA39_LY11998 [Lamprigera yunnana]